MGWWIVFAYVFFMCKKICQSYEFRALTARRRPVTGGVAHDAFVSLEQEAIRDVSKGWRFAHVLRDGADRVLLAIDQPD